MHYNSIYGIWLFDLKVMKSLPWSSVWCTGEQNSLFSMWKAG